MGRLRSMLGKRRFFPLLALAFAACSNQGGCQGLGDPVDQHVDKKYIQNNAVQARLSAKGFEFVESDLMLLVEAALQKPLVLKIPKTPVPAQNPYVTICDSANGCDATLKVIPGTIEIARAAPDSSGKSQLTVNARVEIEAKNLLYMAADKGQVTKDCQIDVRFVDHWADVCRAPGQSWAKPSNPYDSSTDAATRWNTMKGVCNAYCNSPSGNAGRGVGATVTIGVDSSLGYPTVNVEGIDLSFASVPNCPAANDLRIYHPKRTAYTCADNNTKHPECEVFDQSILYDAPLTCLGVQFIYDTAVAMLMDALRVGAKIAINQELTKALSVKCAADKDCQAGATCSTIKVADGFPAGCSGSACMLQPVTDKVCNANGKVVPPLAGIERQINLATLSPAYTPDNAGAVKVIAGVGGFVANDSNQELQARGVPQVDGNRGLTIGGFFGVDTLRAHCVAPKARPQLTNVAPLQIPDKVDLYDATTKGMVAKDYQAAVSLHKDALAQLGYAMYTNGALCLTFAGTPDFPLNSSVLSFIVTSVKDLDLGGETRPAFLYIYPEEVPEITIGEGKIHYEADKPVIDSPHMKLAVKKLKIEFYSMVRERFVRLFSLGLDFEIGVFLEFKEDNTLLPVTSDLKGGLSGITVKNVELLAEQSADLEKSLPGLLDFALPLVSQALLQGIALPSPTVLPGYDFKLVGLRGMKQVTNSAPAQFEFLSGFGKLQKAGTPARDEDVIAVSPRVSIERVEAKDGMVPKVTVAVAAANAAEDSDDLEFSYSLNGGVYSPFSPARSFVVEREQLRFQGPHSLEVRARKRGTLAISEPVSASFVVTETVSRVKQPSAESASSGCNAGGAGAWWLVFAILPMFFRRRRA